MESIWSNFEFNTNFDFKGKKYNFEFGLRYFTNSQGLVDQDNGLMLFELLHDTFFYRKRLFPYSDSFYHSFATRSLVTNPLDRSKYLVYYRNYLGNSGAWIQVIKLDSNLNLIWRRGYRASIDNPAFFGSVNKPNADLASDGGLYIAGGGIDTNAYSNAYILRIDKNGNPISAVSGVDHFLHIVPYESIAIEIFPNPSQGDFTIRSSNPIKMGIYRMYNAMGQLVHEAPIKNSQIHTTVSKGVYYIQVLSNELEILTSRKVEIVE
jgi:hypothetical protein